MIKYTRGIPKRLSFEISLEDDLKIEPVFKLRLKGLNENTYYKSFPCKYKNGKVTTKFNPIAAAPDTYDVNLWMFTGEGFQTIWTNPLEVIENKKKGFIKTPKKETKIDLSKEYELLKEKIKQLAESITAGDVSTTGQSRIGPVTKRKVITTLAPSAARPSKKLEKFLRGDLENKCHEFSQLLLEAKGENEDMLAPLLSFLMDLPDEVYGDHLEQFDNLLNDLHRCAVTEGFNFSHQSSSAEKRYSRKYYVHNRQSILNRRKNLKNKIAHQHRERLTNIKAKSRKTADNTFKTKHNIRTGGAHRKNV